MCLYIKILYNFMDIVTKSIIDVKHKELSECDDHIRT